MKYTFDLRRYITITGNTPEEIILGSSVKSQELRKTFQTEFFEAVKDNIEARVGAAKEIIVACKTRKELEAINLLNLTPGTKEVIVDFMIRFQEKHNISQIATGYYLNLALSSFSAAYLGNVNQMVSIKVKELDKAPTLVDASGKSL